MAFEQQRNPLKMFSWFRFLNSRLFKTRLGSFINSVKTINISLELKMQMAIIQHKFIKKAAFTLKRA